jgi:hypothetical protein
MLEATWTKERQADEISKTDLLIRTVRACVIYRLFLCSFTAHYAVQSQSSLLLTAPFWLHHISHMDLDLPVPKTRHISSNRSRNVMHCRK